MASTSSPRDFEADSNPESARKRPRLSDSPEDSVVIEALASESLGYSLADAIEIDDEAQDVTRLIGLYSDSFQIGNISWPPCDQLGWLYQKIISDKEYIPHQPIACLSSWLAIHIEETNDEDRAKWLHRYSDDAAFFTRLGEVAMAFLYRDDDFFEPGAADTSQDLSDHVTELLVNLAALSARFTRIMPSIMKERLSRRDSAQPSQGNIQQTVPFIGYLSLASDLLQGPPDTPPFRKQLMRELGFKAKPTRSRCRSFFRPIEARCFASLYQLFGHSAREIKNAWPALGALQKLLRIFVPDSEDRASDILGTIRMSILPSIREKHPRALTPGFHEKVVELAADIVTLCVNDNVIEASRFYETYLRSEDDALISDSDLALPMPAAIQKAAKDRPDFLAPLLKATCVMHSSKAFIASSIMDIRSCGVRLLNRCLKEIYDSAQTDGGTDSPVSQYAVRFLRVNEMVSYIFSPDSHATLVSHCADTVCFLAVSQQYTDQDTDIIWHAWTSSVEAGFAKACVNVIHLACQRLPFDHILYVVKKFASTSIAKLEAHAVRLLPKLLKLLEEKSLASYTDDCQLSIVLTCLDILRAFKAQGETSASRPLWLSLMTAIQPSALCSDQRQQLYRRLIPDISYSFEDQGCGSETYLRRADRATCAFEVLWLFLSEPEQALEDAELLAKMFSIRDLVDEARQLATRASLLRESEIRDVYSPALLVRFKVLVSLMSLLNVMCDDATEQAIFSTFFGDCALDNDARDTAWSSLHSMAQVPTIAASAAALLGRFLNNFVPSIEAAHATPSLIGLIKEPITQQIQADILRDNLDRSALLHLPLWTTLVRIATDCADPTVTSLASDTLCQLLFPCSRSLCSKFAIVQNQSDFVRIHLEQLSTKFIGPNYFASRRNSTEFCRALDLLGTVLSKSKATESDFRADERTGGIVVGTPTTQAGFSLSLQLYSPHADCRNNRYSVCATTSTTINEVIEALKEDLKVAEFRIVAGGRLIDSSADGGKTLGDVGVQASGAMTICPKYSFDCDLDLVLTPPGPIEQEILAQYQTLEDFLDGPSEIAERTFAVLSSIRPSAKSRWRVAAADDDSVGTLFPAASPWRTKLSIYVMTAHLKDFARLGVADSDYIMKCTRLLTRIIMDAGRELQPKLMTEILCCLLAFLQERPITETPVKYFVESPALASRLVSILLGALQQRSSAEDGPGTQWDRVGLIPTAYAVLLEASRLDDQILPAFLQNGRSPELHARLLLNDDTNLAWIMSNTIKNYCYEQATQAAVGAYWETVILSQGIALQHPSTSRPYFTLVKDLFEEDQELQSDEARLRALIQTLLESLWEYGPFHQECCGRRPPPDPAMTGLLPLIEHVVTSLRNLKKPVRLQGVPVMLAERLLFAGKSEYLPLLNDESRALAFNLVKATCESKADYRGLLCVAHSAMSRLIIEPGSQFPGLNEWLRCTPHGGLPNLGMTCYMNSLLQQMFANVPLRSLVYNTPVVDEERQVFLTLVQALFARMQESNNPIVDTTQLAIALNVQTQNQEDVHSFYATFLNKLEECMPDSDAKAALSSVFTGKFVSQIRGECGHVSSRIEPFVDMSITVKNKSSLQESLDEFVQGEPMQGANKYRCLTCGSEDGGQLVDAMKRTALEELPDSLTLCLKRFTMESMLGIEGKVNDRFEFPSEIDMSAYKRAHLEGAGSPNDADWYELVGVIVHTGTLEYGHYWSYVRAQSEYEETWVQLEDQVVKPCPGGLAYVQDQCFGGQKLANGVTRIDNAYVLFYQRKQSLQDQQAPVAPPSHVRQNIHDDNLWRHGVSQVFSPQFNDFAEWLLDLASTYNIGENDGMHEDVTAEIASVAAGYLLRVILEHPNPEAKLKAVLPTLTTALGGSRLFCGHLIRCLTEDPRGFASIWRHPSHHVRLQISNLVQTAVHNLRETDPATYDYSVRQILDAHATWLHGNFDGYPYHWMDYLAFAATIGRLGPVETSLVLDHGYLNWCLEVLCLEIDKDSQQRHSWLSGCYKKLDHRPLFAFLSNILEHVDLSTVENVSPREGVRTFVNERVLLRDEELDALIQRAVISNKIIWIYPYVACNRCPVPDSWFKYPPGEFMGVLSSDRVHPSFHALIDKAMFARFDNEETHLAPLLHMTAYLCRSKGDAARGLLKRLGAVLTMWEDDFTLLCLDAMKVFLSHAPGATLESIPEWAPHFLQRRSLAGREATCTWLRELLLGGTDGYVAGMDRAAQRVRVIRALATDCEQQLRHAYERANPKLRHAQMLNVLLIARSFLLSVHRDAKSAMAIGTTLSPEMHIEVDETAFSVTRLDALMDDLREWDVEIMSVMDMMDTREASENPTSVEDEEIDSSGVDDFPSD